MTHYKKLIGKKCYLSPFSMEDAEAWTGWDNDLLSTIPLGEEAYRVISLEKQTSMLGKMAEREHHWFSIVSINSDRLVGRCMLFEVDQVNQNAMLGIFIGSESDRDKGIGTEATQLLLDYGFNLLNLNNIWLGVFSYNKRAIKCYENIGFKRVGARRQARTIAGERHDVVLMDILAEEFESPFVKGLFDSNFR